MYLKINQGTSGYSAHFTFLAFIFVNCGGRYLDIDVLNAFVSVGLTSKWFKLKIRFFFGWWRIRTGRTVLVQTFVCVLNNRSWTAEQIQKNNFKKSNNLSVKKPAPKDLLKNRKNTTSLPHQYLKDVKVFFKTTAHFAKCNLKSQRDSKISQQLSELKQK